MANIGSSLSVFVDSASSILLQHVRLLDPVSESDRIADVLLSEGKILSIASHIPNNTENIPVFNAEGLILGPGLVDIYSHSGEPGYEERETLSTLLTSAIAGGFTQIAILPDTMPPLDTPTIVEALSQKSQSYSHQTAKPYFWGTLTHQRKGKQMAELADLVAAGVIGFTDACSIENLDLLRRLLEYLKPFHKPIALVPVNDLLQGTGVMREGNDSIRLGLPGNPMISEAVAIAAILEMVATIETPVHLMRVSTQRGVELIADAKKRGLPVTASTTWMHLLLNTEAISSYDANLRLEPPLGNESDRKALAEGVKEGVIDAIAIDHTPYTYEEKTVSFAEAPPGAIGLELALPLLWQKLVVSGEWTALQLWKALSTNPQLCLQQQPSSCTPEQVANLTLFDPQHTWIVNSQTLHSLSVNTSWLGKQIIGKIVKVWC